MVPLALQRGAERSDALIAELTCERRFATFPYQYVFVGLPMLMNYVARGSAPAFVRPGSSVTRCGGSLLKP